MDYSHGDRLEGFRTLYMALAGEQKNFYDAKEQWESVSDVGEEYFWTALEDMHRNELLEVQDRQLSGKNNIDLEIFSAEEYDSLNKIRVPRTWSLDADGVSEFKEHFEKHDKPDLDDYKLGTSECSLEVQRDIQKGRKSVEYLLENDVEKREASLRLEVEFTVPLFSPEVEEVFKKYADDYINKLERQEVNEVRGRIESNSRSNQKSTAI